MENKYVVYSGPNCPRCKEIKKYMDDKGILYNEVNIREDISALNLLKRKGFTSIPQVFLNGVPFCDWQTYKERL